MKKTIGLLAALVSLPTLAGWALDSDNSHVSFVSVKKSQISESHHFKSISGTINGKAVSLSIDLASVDTGIPIRDERMAKYLFATELFPKATFAAEIPDTLLKSIKVGEAKHFDLAGKITIKNQSKPVNVKTMIVKIANGNILVNSTKPFIINAKDFNLSTGIAKLAELASLPSITESVPVSFSLTFNE